MKATRFAAGDRVYLSDDRQSRGTVIRSARDEVMAGWWWYMIRWDAGGIEDNVADQEIERVDVIECLAELDRCPHAYLRTP